MADSADRVIAAGDEWHEGRLIEVHLYIDRDGSEGWGATFGRDLTLEERRSLLSQAAALLANGQLPDEPPRSA